ncbi:MAG: ribonuclease III [candidate division KSB1 bacterium]|nr:ribonuclease III [candidate division KSB1 bacterium]MDZ7295586.1 ribonuclease III [candidate division KSB1 bacterium]MDZ7338909.1 ribonuclease III [candidate division KSB1 bacterium]MDZ7377858.1 ribonuclease III [candidate division KSB1 bacterium]MDZ7385866.1 ribonuclease III [candidate division KSB1 bacterium]
MRLLPAMFRRLFRHQPGPRENALRALSRKLGYQFRNPAHLTQALKHRSYLVESGEPRYQANERLELLGDAVLALVVVEYLYQRYPRRPEGELTVMKSLAVSRPVLANVARGLEVGPHLLLSEQERKAGGANRPSILADAIEAIIGAVYLDGGLEPARKLVHRLVISRLDSILEREENQNYKSLLLEYCQREKMPLPLYSVQREDGPEHDKVFTVAVTIGGKKYGTGQGRTKKSAEQRAARGALVRLRVI